MPPLFEGKAFDVEHALSMYALSFVTLPAFAIYDKETVGALRSQIEDCHIYLVGSVPKVDFVHAEQRGADLVAAFTVSGQRYELEWPLPKNCRVVGDAESGCYIEDSAGRRFFPSSDEMVWRLAHEKGIQNFDVLYIGQAYGSDGSRNALDRLLKHETLQKIAVTGVPPDHTLTILMLAIEPANRMITVFNPHAQDQSQGSKRIAAGVEKLFNTDEAERITLYEASLIRYFQPKFNKEFKESFPSTNLKVLADCYDKDFAAVIAEISIDELPYQLRSETVAAAPLHIAYHDLHSEPARNVFFSLK